MKDVKSIEVADEFHACPSCDYERGFHVSFRRKGADKALKLILICPNCGTRYDISKDI